MGEMPWSPAEAEQKLADIIDQLGEEVTNLKRLTVDAAKAKHAYELAAAKEYAVLRAEWRLSHQEAERRLILSDSVTSKHLEYVTSEAVSRGAFKYIDVLKSQADALRSLLVSARGVSS